MYASTYRPIYIPAMRGRNTNSGSVSRPPAPNYLSSPPSIPIKIRELKERERENEGHLMGVVEITRKGNTRWEMGENLCFILSLTVVI
jgi:hypothetical protein